MSKLNEIKKWWRQLRIKSTWMYERYTSLRESQITLLTELTYWQGPYNAQKNDTIKPQLTNRINILYDWLRDLKDEECKVGKMMCDYVNNGCFNIE